jgi:hypothetical protein
MLSTVDAAFGSLPDTCRIIRELCGCQEETIGDSGQNAHNVTPIVNNKTAALWEMVPMKSNNATLVYIVYRGQQGDGISSTQPPMCAGHR